MKFGIISTDIRATETKIKQVNDSRLCFAKGMEFLEASNYRQLLINLSNVIEEDANYEKAQQLINENIETYLAASLEEAETLSNEKKFDLAITVINEALSVLPDEASLLAKKERYVSEGEAYKEE